MFIKITLVFKNRKYYTFTIALFKPYAHKKIERNGDKK